MYPLILETTLPNLKVFKRTPHWDIYRLNDRLLFVALDRVSWRGDLFPSGIPYKGVALAKILETFYSLLKGDIPNHFLTSDLKRMSTDLQKSAEILEGRSLLVKKTSVIPVECQVKRRLIGKYWKNRAHYASMCEFQLPENIKEGEALKTPVLLFKGKRRNGKKGYLSTGQVAEIIGDKIAEELGALTIKAFETLEEFVASRGFVLSQIKLKWGLYNGDLLLIDETLSGEDSIFWEKSPIKNSKLPPSFEREPLFRFIEQHPESPEIPALPPEVIQEVSERYQHLCYQLTGYKVKREV